MPESHASPRRRRSRALRLRFQTPIAKLLAALLVILDLRRWWSHRRFPLTLIRLLWGNGTVFKIAKRVVSVVARTFAGTYHDGFMYAGNLAYLSLIALFPFFITATAIASLFGQSEAGLAAVETVLRTMPAGVAEVVHEPVQDVLTARTGPLLWFGALVGLWTVGNLIETIRDILRRAYGSVYEQSFWRYRLFSAGLVVGAVLLMLLSFSLQLLIVAVDQLIAAFAPSLTRVLREIWLSRFVPLVGLFVTLYFIFLLLTPTQYRGKAYPTWPGALLTMLWWAVTLWGLPLVLSHMLSYDLTYGSLAGVMITLLFFYVVGLGLVAGAEFNAAIAQVPRSKDESKAMAHTPGTQKARTEKAGTQKARTEKAGTQKENR